VIAMKKNEIIRKGIELGAPLHLTWSCYQSEQSACGVLRQLFVAIEGIRGSGNPDPIPYQRKVLARG